MTLVDALRTAVDISLHPGVATKKSMGTGDALRFYYKESVLLGIVAIAFAVLGFLVAQHFAITAVAVGGQLVAAASLTNLALDILQPWVIIPISLLVDAAILHLFGKLAGKFNKGYSGTLTAYAYGAMPNLLFLWLLLFTEFVSQIASLVVILIQVIWSIVVLVIALANQHKTSRLAAFGVWLLTVAVVAVVIFALIFGLISVFHSTLVPALNSTVH